MSRVAFNSIAKTPEGFARQLKGLSEEAVRKLRAELREAKGVYFVKTYTVHAHFRKVPKRRRNQ